MSPVAACRHAHMDPHTNGPASPDYGGVGLNLDASFSISISKALWVPF